VANTVSPCPTQLSGELSKYKTNAASALTERNENKMTTNIRVDIFLLFTPER
jgi:hypothetical protein